MTLHTGTSPNFVQPPVVETALTIQFEELAPFPVTMFGKFHRIVEREFPNVESRPAITPITETFPIARQRPARLLLETGIPPVRALFIAQDPGSELLQVQHDRFAFNWRANEATEYPRFRTNLARCLSYYEKFCHFCKAEAVGEVKPNLCEVMYANHIYPRTNESVTDAIASIYEGIAWKTSDNWLPNPEVATLNRTYVIGNKEGRLYSEMSSACDSSGKEFLLWKLTSRILGSECKNFDVNDAFSRAHEWVVWSFCSSTRTDAQTSRWERKQP